MAKKKSNHMKLRIMPDDGRWAWWEEYITSDPIKVTPTEVGYTLSYTLVAGERRTQQCLMFKLDGKYKGE